LIAQPGLGKSKRQSGLPARNQGDSKAGVTR